MRLQPLTMPARLLLSERKAAVVPQGSSDQPVKKAM
jgi:hypothetical protein